MDKMLLSKGFWFPFAVRVALTDHVWAGFGSMLQSIKSAEDVESIGWNAVSKPIAIA